MIIKRYYMLAVRFDYGFNIKARLFLFFVFSLLFSSRSTSRRPPSPFFFC